MTDQTRWGIPEVQMKNKAKAFEDQKEMREEIKNFVFNCSVYSLHKMYEEMKRLEKNGLTYHKRERVIGYCGEKLPPNIMLPQSQVVAISVHENVIDI